MLKIRAEQQYAFAEVQLGRFLTKAKQYYREKSESFAALTEVEQSSFVEWNTAAAKSNGITTELDVVWFGMICLDLGADVESWLKSETVQEVLNNSNLPSGVKVLQLNKLYEERGSAAVVGLGETP